MEECNVALLLSAGSSVGKTRSIATAEHDHVALEELAEVRWLLALGHSDLDWLTAHGICPDRVATSQTCIINMHQIGIECKYTDDHNSNSNSPSSSTVSSAAAPFSSAVDSLPSQK